MVHSLNGRWSCVATEGVVSKAGTVQKLFDGEDLLAITRSFELWKAGFHLVRQCFELGALEVLVNSL